MDAQFAREILHYHADRLDSPKCDELSDVALFIKQQQNTIVNLRLADKDHYSAKQGLGQRFEQVKEELSVVTAENARLKEWNNKLIRLI